jgi:hypothetical protein
MKYPVSKLVLFAASSAIVVTASALPPLPKYIEDYYTASPEHAKYAELYKGLEGDHKCDSCHKPGVDKKMKGHGLNDYGEAVHKHFKHRDFNKADKLGQSDPQETAKARQILADALAKAAQEKNAAGQAFGDLIKAGKLPGNNP